MSCRYRAALITDIDAASATVPDCGRSPGTGNADRPARMTESQLIGMITG